jgi:hypothetical protein
MNKIIGKIPVKQLQRQQIRKTRKVKHSGILLGSAIITNIKGIPGINFARCSIRRNNQGLHAIRNGIYIRPVKSSIVKDTSFQPV